MKSETDAAHCHQLPEEVAINQQVCVEQHITTVPVVMGGDAASLLHLRVSLPIPKVIGILEEKSYIHDRNKRNPCSKLAAVHLGGAYRPTQFEGIPALTITVSRACGLKNPLVVLQQPVAAESAGGGQWLGLQQCGGWR